MIFWNFLETNSMNFLQFYELFFGFLETNPIRFEKNSWNLFILKITNSIKFEQFYDILRVLKKPIQSNLNNFMIFYVF
jgi:hypothetical protein